MTNNRPLSPHITVHKWILSQIMSILHRSTAIGFSFGSEIVNSNQIVHGKTSMIKHNNCKLFKGLKNPFEATRYHSLVINKENLSNELEIIAECDDIIMGIKHKKYPLYGVQFHPESIKTHNGLKIIENFLYL